MESLLLLIPLLACPLLMATMGVIGWLWAKVRGRSKKAEERSMGSTPEPSAASGDVAAEGA